MYEGKDVVVGIRPEDLEDADPFEQGDLKVLADVGLYLPDFRAAERSFQQIAQVGLGSDGLGEDHGLPLAALAHDLVQHTRQAVEQAQPALLALLVAVQWMV